jgi:hypothetical protein
MTIGTKGNLKMLVFIIACMLVCVAFLAYELLYLCAQGNYTCTGSP